MQAQQQQRPWLGSLAPCRTRALTLGADPRGWALKPRREPSHCILSGDTTSQSSEGLKHGPEAKSYAILHSHSPFMAEARTYPRRCPLRLRVENSLYMCMYIYIHIYIHIHALNQLKLEPYCIYINTCANEYMEKLNK